MLVILLALLLLSHVPFFATATRLQQHHRSVFDRMQFDGMLFCGSFEQLGRLLMFVLKGKHSRLKDTFLTVTGCVFAISFVITLPSLLMYLLLRI